MGDKNRILEGILASDTIAIPKNKHSLTPSPLNIKPHTNSLPTTVLLPDIACVAFDKKFMRHAKSEKTV